MAGKRVTINDVAAAAGVSRQTVTRAMNEMSEISPETRERVLRASEVLGYRPSRFAQNLARQKHHSVGLVLASLRNPYYTDLAADILDVASERGWQVTVDSVEASADIAVVTRLATQVDAIVGYFSAPAEDLARAARGVPVVLIERTDRRPGIHTVALDFEQGLSDLVSQLRDRGSRRFAMVDSHRLGGLSVPTPRRRVLERLIGEDAPILSAEESLPASAKAFAQLMGAHPEVDTVIAFNDLMAMGMLQSAHTLGISVPEDVKIVGIDGLLLGEVMSPPLSTLSIDRVAVANAIVDIVAECVVDGITESTSRVVVPRPLWRASA